MPEKLQGLLSGVAEKIIAYLPNLFAGIILIIVGWMLGWFLKRLVIQMAILLKLERLLVRFRWGREFSKGDVRHGFYSFLGNIVFAVIFLIFINNALSAWKLTVLSSLLGKAILFLPRIAISLVVLFCGWLISSWSAAAGYKAMRRESIPYASLISRMAKAMMLLFFCAMAIAELDIARVIVVIGFATVFITMGVIAIVLTALGGKGFLHKMQNLQDGE